MPAFDQERVADAAARGQPAATADTYASMGLSRGAAALGVALALGEIDEAVLGDDVLGRDLTLWSGCASSSAGIELMHNDVVVLRNSGAWSGDRAIAHAVPQGETGRITGARESTTASQPRRT